ncbi:hypothetical protein [Lichenibacterium dinghuense]|uniref:hypothetical protein n=1 Tax=Lichenibacterium dinghuense TaxID=2895977 RepID=UPI001F3F2FFB|nr:hypothetical protein [Lichenibacterium sp. 6Y81]
MDDENQDTGGHAPGMHPDGFAARRKPLPTAAPGESLKAYVARVAVVLAAWLDATRRWRRRAEWEVIRRAVEAAYGDPVALKTLETYLAAARKAGVAPSVPVTPEPPAVPAPPTTSDKSSSGGRSAAQRSRASTRAPDYQRFIAPRS